MTWIENAQKLLQRDLDQGCDAGHDRHERDVVWVHAPGFKGNMEVFAAETYRDTHGYCPGDDDVSRTLQRYGIWEPIETQFFLLALSMGEGLVIDFGTQIGWYSMLATTMGRDVLGIEPILEHAELTRINTAGRPGRLFQARHWLDIDTPTLPAKGCPPISVVKIDVEGAEIHALRCIKELLNAEKVANVLMEVSSVFNDTYPPLVRDLLDRGFIATALNPVMPVDFDNYEEVIATIPQVDMMFSLP